MGRPQQSEIATGFGCRKSPGPEILLRRGGGDLKLASLGAVERMLFRNNTGDAAIGPFPSLGVAIAEVTTAVHG